MAVDRRFLIPAVDAVPDRSFYATDGGEDDTRQERGPQPSPPVRDDGNLGGIDLSVVKRPAQPVLHHLDGEVRVALSGDIGAGTMLWRRDGDVRFKGKSDFCDLDESLVVRTGTTQYFHHPQILSMSNGELLVSWAEHPTSDVTDTAWKWYVRILDPRSYQFGPIIEIPSVSGSGVSVERSADSDVPAFVVAESDVEPGHLTAVGIGDVNNGTDPTEYDIITFTSRDWGRTWNVQSIDSTSYATGTVKSCDALYSNGRLVLVIEGNGAADNVFAYYSNDHGISWVSVGEQFTTYGANQGGCCLVRTHNNALLLFGGNETGAGGQPLQVSWSGDNGVSWTEFTDHDIQSTATSTADNSGIYPAAMLDDSGYVCLYWYCRNATDDACFFSRLGIRDITLNEVTKVSNIFDDGTQEFRESSVWDELIATGDQNIREIAVDNWRGRAALMTLYEDTTRTIALHVANRWNGLRYHNYGSDALPAWYNLFLPFDHPDQHGAGVNTWVLTGQKTNNAVYENGGYYIEDDGVNADYFTSAAGAVAYPPVVTKVMCRCLDGGNLAAQEVFLDIRNATDDISVGVWLSDAGFQVRDSNGAGADVGPEIATDMSKWHEFVFHINDGDQELVQVYWRMLDPENDGEFVQYNELLGANVALDTTAIAASVLEFGHIATASAKSEWRPFKEQRPAGSISSGAYVEVYDPDDSFDLWWTAAGEMESSDRPPQISETFMYLADGVGVSWNGAGALARNRWEVATRADFPITRTMEGGPTQPWGAQLSSLDAAEYCNLVFDAGQDRKFRMGAIALFGCNCPFVTVEMNDADDWVAPPVSISSVLDSAPASGTSFRRGEKLRSITGVDSLLDVKAIDGNAVRVSNKTQTNTDPFRPHQYRPTGTRVWYVVQKTDGYVWRVEDNSSDTLYLNEAPEPAMTTSDDLVLFSDRFMIDMTTDADVDDDFGFRFLRISIGDATTPTYLRTPAAERFLKIGRIVPGALHQVSDPNWGFSKRITPNVRTRVGMSGTVSARKLGPMLERWNINWPPLPPERMDAANAIRDLDVWQRVENLLLATGLGERSVVMAHNAFDLDDTSWLRVTGNDLLLGRVTGAVEARHETYYGIEDFAELPESVGEMMSIGGVSISEEA